MEAEYDVFISYATPDKGTADAVCHYLEAENIRCWIASRDIPPGAHWDEHIPEAVRCSRLMVLIFSSNANDSHYVQSEVILASKYQRVIIPFRVEDVAPSGGLELHLARRNWLDALTPPLEKGIRELVVNVQRLLSAELTGTEKLSGHGRVSAANGNALNRKNAGRIHPSRLFKVLGIVFLLGIIAVLGYLSYQRVLAARGVMPPAQEGIAHGVELISEPIGKSDFFIKERVGFTVRSDRELWVYLCATDSRGDSAVLFPTKKEDNPHILAGGTIDIGVKNGSHIVMEKPVGMVNFVLYGSTGPIEDSEFRDKVVLPIGQISPQEYLQKRTKTRVEEVAHVNLNVRERGENRGEEDK